MPHDDERPPSIFQAWVVKGYRMLYEKGGEWLRAQVLRKEAHEEAAEEFGQLQPQPQTQKPRLEEPPNNH